MFDAIFNILVIIGLFACYPVAMAASFVLHFFLGERTIGDLEESDRIASKLLLRYMYDLAYTYEHICGKGAVDDLMSRIDD